MLYQIFYSVWLTLAGASHSLECRFSSTILLLPDGGGGSAVVAVAIASHSSWHRANHKFTGVKNENISPVHNAFLMKLQI